MYATALWKAVERGSKPKDAVRSLHANLEASGRTALMPGIARAFARIAARETQRNGIVLSIAREMDERRAHKEVANVLAEMGMRKEDIKTAIDKNVIGGWRLEGRGRLIDATYKKYLLDMYNAATK